MGDYQTKTTIRFFTPDNYEKEEKYLRDMSLHGWHFKSFAFLFYHFEKGQPEDYYYRLDYKKNIKEDMADYFQMFSDDKWDHIFQFSVFGGAWEYFRKQSRDGNEHSIYTDDESKIELFTRIRNTWSIFGFFIILLCFAPGFHNILTLATSGEIAGIVIIILQLVVCLIYLKLFVSMSLKINQLKKKYNR